MIGNLRPLFELLWPAGGDVGLLLERRVLAAKWVLVLERIWRGLLWPFVVTGGFVFVSLLGIWNVVPAWVHSFGLLAYAVALIAALASLAHIGWPGRGEALRRLERDSGARHRPASSYDDKLANNVSATSEALWRLHRQRLARLIQALKFSVPNPRLDRFDPFAPLSCRYWSRQRSRQEAAPGTALSPPSRSPRAVRSNATGCMPG